MAAIDLDHLKTWVGKTKNDSDTASLRHARLLAATLDVDSAPLKSGAPLPPLWHWIYFLEGDPTSTLGPDGHPARGSFLPPVPLSNRMWAGGRFRFERDVPLGSLIEKQSTISKVDHKQGRTGDLVFVTVTHEIFVEKELAIHEEHDIVYKNATPPGNAPGSPASMTNASWVREFLPTSTTLFRYSALTFNGHRIHYDSDYCRRVEGYENVVIHGPLNATLLANLANDMVKPMKLKSFEYRCLRPALLGQKLYLKASESDGVISLAAQLSDGSATVVATAHS
jgi:3-methylfumaryl-CoA hydratase